MATELYRREQVYPPRGEADFTTALERLATPVVHQMVRCMEPVSPVYSSCATLTHGAIMSAGGRRSAGLSRSPTLPARINPRFGQGMSAATVSARLLQQCLAGYGVADFAPAARFLRRTGAFSTNAVAVRGGR